MSQRPLLGLSVPLLVVIAGGCVGPVPRLLPPEIRTVFVGEVRSSAAAPLLSQIVGEEIRWAIRMDGRLVVVEDEEKADAVLAGAIVEYAKIPSRYDATNVIQEYELRLAADFSFRDTKLGDALWRERGETISVTGPVRRFASSTNFVVVPASGVPVDTEESAQRQLARDFSRRIIRKALEGL